MTTRRERNEGGKWWQSIPEEGLRVMILLTPEGPRLSQFAYSKAAEAGWTWESDLELFEKWRRWMARYNATGRTDLVEP